MLKVAFHNLGCKVNSYENEKMIQMFREKEYKIVPFDQKADIYIINTCTVTNIADRKSRQMIHRARQLNPDAVVVACGCYVETFKDKNDGDKTIDLAVKNREKPDIVRIVEEYLKEKEDYKEKEAGPGSVKDICPESGKVPGHDEHTRAVIKVQDGCDQFCSYCIIPFVRGRISSRDDEDIADEIKTLRDRGFKEVVITGIHLSSFGLDREEEKRSYNSAASKGEYTNKALMELIRKVSETEGIERIRLGSLEPRIITDEFLSFLSKTPKFCPHFHLSLQSGSD
ncbi:MAG: radical SAM protein, partial [Lachnospiraceae bacterium]|nr:radical SAM protein [Lachnospiraceae bacterium]